MNDTWAMRPSATTLTTTSTTRPNLPTPPYLGPNSAVQGRSSRSASPAPSVHYPNPVFQWVRGELIGKGSYGRVYLGMNATTGAIMAVKQVEKPTTRSDQVDKRQIEVIQALKEESATLQDLDHENIVQYLGFEESATNLSIFLEYVPGGTIGSCLQNRGQAFSEGVTKSFGYQILLGIEYLHSRGILHRDLKSENILVEPIGVCKISDFGISKRLSSQDAEERAFTELRGTLFWMAPEVVNSRERGYDTKIDIWSVGCVMLEMWTGKRPWQGEQPIPVMMKLYRDKVAPPLPKGCSLSPAGEDFRLKCFTVDPQFRPSASELLTHSYLIPQKGWVFHRSEIESAPVQVTTSAEVLNRGHRPTSSYDDIATPTQGPGPVDSRWDFRRPSEVGSSSTLTIQIPARSSSAAPATRHQPPDPRP
ncbi:kinase-like domain-containing protein [Flagelloscypha sp. PMI_526]|nr:kinase-like domain-containing protein [Flagelloscypha sp. PMI_526]